MAVIGWIVVVAWIGAKRIRRAMPAADNLPSKSLGLGGDGDEIAAIEEVERRFGIRLNTSDAREWATVGDVFAALQRALPEGRGEADETWTLFTDAICAETGVDPAQVTPETMLLGQRRLDWRLLVAMACLASLGFAIVHHW